RIVAARLTTLRVRELSTRCPLILLLGLNPIQETKAFSLRHLVMLVPISLIKVKIARTFNPGMVVRSTPRMRFRCPAKLVSKATVDFLFPVLPPPKSCDDGIGPAARRGVSQAVILANCSSLLAPHGLVSGCICRSCGNHWLST